jgi:lysyl oxidase
VLRTGVLAFAVVAAVAIAGIVGTQQEGGAEPGLLYPDLESAKPTDLSFDRVKVRRGVRHQVLRFTNSVENVGAGPLDLHGVPVRTRSGEKRSKVYQRVAPSEGNVGAVRKVGMFVYHPSHDHFHFGGFATYELWQRAEYEQWLQSGRSTRQDDPERISTKTTFCVMDIFRLDPPLPDSPEEETYGDCGRTHQGLSVGWADMYIAALPDQWVDLGRRLPPDGSYVLRTVADPGNRLYESPQKSDSTRESRKANAAVTFFEVNAGTITVTDDPARGGEVAQPPSNLDSVAEQLEARGY